MIKSLVNKYIFKQHRIVLGFQNSDKTFFVIRRKSTNVGLFSYVNAALGWIKYATDRGYIPVVDMQFNKSPYLADDKLYKENAWEYYFEQPCGYSLKDIVHSRNIILGSGEAPPDYPNGKMFLDGSLEEWRKYYHKYIRLNSRMHQHIEKVYSNIIDNKGNVLGILARGTDYVESRPKSHPIQPTINELIVKTQDLIAQWEIDAIYLATEDLSYVDNFKTTFGNKVIVSDARCYDYRKQHEKFINDNHFDRDDDAFFKGKEYLTNMVLLSKCKNIECGITSGTYGVYMMNDGFEKEYRWDLGVY